MGTIASVLQWTCHGCNNINPIELIRCPKCDHVRLLLSDSTLGEDEDAFSGSNECEGGPDECIRHSQRHPEHQSGCKDAREESCRHHGSLKGGRACRNSSEQLKNHHSQRGVPLTGYLEIKTDG